VNFSHRLEGGEELEKFLTKFPIKTERKFLIAGLRGGVKRIKSRVRREIKANFKKHTGVLLRSVKHRTVKAKYGAAVIIETSSIDTQTRFIKNKLKRSQKVKALKLKKKKGKFKDAYYARFLIKGTKRGIKPTPFLDTALRGEKTESIKDFQSTMIKAFEKEAMKMLMR